MWFSSFRLHIGAVKQKLYRACITGDQGSSSSNVAKGRKYFVATQDKELRLILGARPGTPLLYLNQVTLVLETPSLHSQEFNKEVRVLCAYAVDAVPMFLMSGWFLICINPCCCVTGGVQQGGAERGGGEDRQQDHQVMMTTLDIHALWCCDVVI